MFFWVLGGKDKFYGVGGQRNSRLAFGGGHCFWVFFLYEGNGKKRGRVISNINK